MGAGGFLLHRCASRDRWVKAVNAEGSYGQWAYAMARKTTEVVAILNRVVEGEPVAANISR